MSENNMGYDRDLQVKLDNFKRDQYEASSGLANQLSGRAESVSSGIDIGDVTSSKFDGDQILLSSFVSTKVNAAFERKVQDIEKQSTFEDREFLSRGSRWFSNNIAANVRKLQKVIGFGVGSISGSRGSWAKPIIYSRVMDEHLDPREKIEKLGNGISFKYNYHGLLWGKSAFRPDFSRIIPSTGRRAFIDYSVTEIERALIEGDSEFRDALLEHAPTRGLSQHVNPLFVSTGISNRNAVALPGTIEEQKLVEAILASKEWKVFRALKESIAEEKMKLVDHSVVFGPERIFTNHPNGAEIRSFIDTNLSLGEKDARSDYYTVLVKTLAANWERDIGSGGVWQDYFMRTVRNQRSKDLNELKNDVAEEIRDLLNTLVSVGDSFPLAISGTVPSSITTFDDFLENYTGRDLVPILKGYIEFLRNVIGDDNIVGYDPSSTPKQNITYKLSTGDIRVSAQVLRGEFFDSRKIYQESLKTSTAMLEPAKVAAQTDYFKKREETNKLINALSEKIRKYDKQQENTAYNLGTLAFESLLETVPGSSTGSTLSPAARFNTSAETRKAAEIMLESEVMLHNSQKALVGTNAQLESEGGALSRFGSNIAYGLMDVPSAALRYTVRKVDYLTSRKDTKRRELTNERLNFVSESMDVNHVIYLVAELFDYKFKYIRGRKPNVYFDYPESSLMEMSFAQSYGMLCFLNRVRSEGVLNLRTYQNADLDKYISKLEKISAQKIAQANKDIYQSVMDADREKAKLLVKEKKDGDKEKKNENTDHTEATNKAHKTNLEVKEKIQNEVAKMFAEMRNNPEYYTGWRDILDRKRGVFERVGSFVSDFREKLAKKDILPRTKPQIVSDILSKKLKHEHTSEQ